LRRSHEVRSLNFSHGLPQVSSRTAKAAALHAKIGGIGEPAKQHQVDFDYSTYACRYWVSATIGRIENDVNRLNSAIPAGRTQLDHSCSTLRQS
jgi:hypothetical protein